MKILIPQSLTGQVSVSPGDALVRYDPTLPIDDADLDAEVLVAFGNTTDQLRDSAERLGHLRWVQSLSAGSDAILAAGFSESVLITSGRSLHSATVAEHTLALILAALRSLPELGRLQAKHQWSELGGSQSESPDDPIITLLGARVTIWGFGSIAETLAPLLASLGADVVGVARSAGERAGFPVISNEGLDARLARTDILVVILPGTPENARVVNAHRMAQLPSRAWIVNVGRGSTLDEGALLDALDSRTIAGAALDVFEREPLPADSPLWDQPNVIITPHSAGGRPRGADALISRNLRAFREGGRLENVVRDPSDPTQSQSESETVR